MKVILHLLVFIVFSVVMVNGVVNNKICRLFKENTKIRHPLSPRKYINCNGTAEEVIKCPGHYIFDENLQKCSRNIYRRKSLKNACWDTSNMTMKASEKSCRQFYFCLNNKAYSTTCEDDYHFDPYKKQCVPPHEFPCIKNVNLCNFVVDNTSFLHESDCSKYYKCENGRLKENYCRNLYFDVKTGTCLSKRHITCIHHPSTSTTCLKDNKPFVGAVSDGVTCQGYFNCTDKGDAYDLQPKWLQCPDFTFFSEISEKCMLAIDVKCNLNRCEGHGNEKSVSEKNNCRNYYQCKDNSVLEEYTCEYDYVFDESVQKCVDRIFKDKACYKGPN